MASPLDFNAALGEQLRNAAEQMRAMSRPQKKNKASTNTAQNAAPAVSETLGEGSAAPTQLESTSTDTTPVTANTTAAPTAAQTAVAAAPATSEQASPTAEAAATDTADDTAPGTADNTVHDAVATETGAAHDSETVAQAVTSTPVTAGQAVTESLDKTVLALDQTHAEESAAAAAGTVTATAASAVTTTDMATDISTALAATNHAATAAGQLGSGHALAGDAVAASAVEMPHNGAPALVSPHLPDAASELWAMSQHADTPTLSDRSWSGGVRGAVLTALRTLAADSDHVLVNLKRLATHTGISYGSVRNAMSRLTRSGDIRTRQIRMADGHGVRVDFLTSPGREGTGQSLTPAVHGQNAAGSMASVMQTALGAGSNAFTTDTATALHTATVTHAAPMAVAGLASVTAPVTAPSAVSPAVRATAQGAATAGAQGTAHETVQSAVTAPASATVGAAVSAPEQASFWNSPDELFACAWPHAAQAGLSMPALRLLAPIFAVQGFDAGLLPPALRHLDWELEQIYMEFEPDTPEAQIKAEARAKSFVSALQRRGFWPKPQGYPEEA